MTAFGIVGDTSQVTVAFIESADPEDLQNKVNAYLASVDGNVALITNIALAGAGDGYTFVVMVESAPATAASNGILGSAGGLAGTVVRCYLGGSDAELIAARERAGVVPPLAAGDPPTDIFYSLLDEQFAGAAKGQRFMGMGIYNLETLPGGVFSPRVIAIGTADQALNAGTTILTFSSLQNAARFGLVSPQEVQYTGPVTDIASVEASVSVLQNGAGDFSVAIVFDPLGAATVLGSIVSHTAAGECDNVSVLAYAELLPIALVDSRIGILVTSGAGTLKGAQLRITG
jgi:hypothetical protein